MPLKALFLVFDWISFSLAGNKEIRKSLDVFEFRLETAMATELAALERLKKKKQCIMLWPLYHLHFCLDLLNPCR